MKKYLLLSFMLTFALVFKDAIAQQRTVSGKVTSIEDGSPLPGVNVVLKGSTSGTVTDIDGQYSLSVPTEGGVLVFSFIGLSTEEVEVGVRSSINLQMSPDVQQLSEVVVVAFGEQSKKTMTSSVSSVNAEEIANVSVPNFERNLQGRAAGVNVSAASGTLGSPAYIRIRGTSSISASSEPLIVIDGVPLVQENVGTTAGGQGQSALSSLNSNDIESVEILKDAAGTALYGSRAANGVILITTKRGKAGKATVNFGGYAGWQEATDLPDMLSGPEFTEAYNESVIGGFESLGQSRADAETSAAGFLLDPDEINDTDWLDLVTRRGFVQEYFANVSGGDENTRYYFGTTYRDEEGWLENNDLTRTGVRVSIDQRITDKIQAGITVSPTRTVINRVSEDNEVNAPYTFAQLIAPVGANTDEEGNLVDDPSPFFRAFNGTPTINGEEQEFVTTTTQTLGSGYLDVEIIDGLSARTDLGFSFFQYEERLRSGQRSTRGFPTGFARALNRQRLNYTWTNLLTYQNSFNEVHNLLVQGGTQYQSSRTTQFFADGTGFPGDPFTTLDSRATASDAGGIDTEFDFFGILGRVQYDYEQRYLFSFNIRRDGSSRFSEGNRFGTFPSVAVGWNIAEESFFEPVGFVNLLKVRASYGQIGNAEIGNFDALALASGDAAYNGNPGTRATQLSNPDLQWETTNQLDVSLDFALFNNRLSGTFTYYNKQTEDLLLDVQIPATNGFATLTQNIGELQNTGIEIDLRGTILQGPVTWDLGVNLATINNEVTELTPDTDIIRFGADGENVVQVGQPVGAFSLVNYAGVDPETGDALFFQTDENGNLTDQTTNRYSLNDRVISGDPFPDFFGGINSTWSWRGIELTTFWQYTVGNDVFREEGQFSQTGPASLFNQETSQLNYWTVDNRNTDIPKPVNTAIVSDAAPNGNQASTRYLEDGSYIRLKTLALGYTLPSDLTGRIGITRAKVFFMGQNLLTFTDYGGPDPEVNSNRADNANVSQGNTFFAAPQARTYTFGLNFTL